MAATILALAALLFSVPGGTLERPLPPFGPGCARADFHSAGFPVRAELCRAPGVLRAPAVVVLYGCGGFGSLDHTLAEGLPRRGISTLYVDYYARTPPPSRKGYCGEGGEIGTALPIWPRTVVDAAASLGRRAGIDGSRIGVVGWSLGGFTALLTAEYGARPFGGSPPRARPFQAAVGYSPGVPGFVLDHADALPPTLLLSAGRTDAVPLDGIVALRRALVSAGVPTAVLVYPHGTHQWRGRQGRVGLDRTVRFLRHYLGSA